MQGCECAQERSEKVPIFHLWLTPSPPPHKHEGKAQSAAEKDGKLIGSKHLRTSLSNHDLIAKLTEQTSVVEHTKEYRFSPGKSLNKQTAEMTNPGLRRRERKVRPDLQSCHITGFKISSGTQRRRKI